LVQLHRDHPDEVDTWVNDENQEFTRASMRYLRNYLSQKAEESDLDTDTPGGDLSSYGGGGDGTELDQDAGLAALQPTSSPRRPDTDGEHGLDETSGSKKARHQAVPGKLNNVIVKVLHYNRVARLMLDRSPPEKGYAWLKYDDDGNEFEATLRDVQLIAVEEGEL
jgi:ParB family chromosome partitioning protein